MPGALQAQNPPVRPSIFDGNRMEASPVEVHAPDRRVPIAVQRTDKAGASQPAAGIRKEEHNGPPLFAA